MKEIVDFKKEVLESNGLVLVDFWADWCGPCKMLTPILESISISNLSIYKVNIDTNSELATKYSIKSIPMLMLFKDGDLISQKAGLMTKEAIESWIATS
jgi:thioredoxin 1